MIIMKIYRGLEYSLKIKNIIIDSVRAAKDDPFANYFIIVDDPLFFEEAFFKHTDTLFNIQIIRYNDLLKKLLDNYHLYKYNELSKLDKILITKELIESTDNIFNTDNKMNLIYELINIFDLFYLEEIKQPPLEHLSSLSKEKITTIITLYKQLLNKIPNNKCYQYEDILFNEIDDALQNNHYLFITEKIFYQHRYNFIKKIAQYSDVTILINDSNDSRDLNIPFKGFDGNEYFTPFDDPYLDHLNTYLFSLQSPKFSSHTPLHTIIQTTPKAQIESVALNIYQNIVDNKKHYHDFAIYYPNQEYLELLIEILDNFNLPHNIKKTVIFKEFEACLLYLKYCYSNDDRDLIALLDTKILNSYNDFNYLDNIKKRYLETGLIEDILSEKYSLLPCVTLTDYCQVMIDFIKNELVYTQNKANVISFFNNLSGEQTFSLKEFYNLVQELKPLLKEEKAICSDHLYLFNYNQCYSGILECSYVYLVGVNETIVPKQYKDTGILLDQDHQILNLPDLTYQIGLSQNNILKALNSNISFIAICFSNATIDGQPLLESSLYIQLKQMFKFTNIDISNNYLHHSLKDKLYLLGGQDINCKSLNKIITHYKQTNNQPTNLTVPIFSTHLSASKLETYNSCPYKYYNQYGLKIYPFKQPLFQTNEIGTIVHYVLEKTKSLFSDYQCANQIDFEDLKKRINNHIDAYILENNLTKRLSYGTNNYIIQMLKHDLFNTIIVLNNQMKVSDFKTIGNEVDINREYSNFNISGIVDRIDQYEQYLKVIDYKSSNKDLDISLAIQGFNIQMLLYLDTLTNQMKLDKGALLYFNTKKRILSSTLKITAEESSDNFFKQYKMNGYVNENVITEIDNSFERESAIIKAKFVKKDDCYKGNILNNYSFERLLAYVNKHIEQLYQELSQGNIGICPKGSDDTAIHTKVNPCNYCNYHSLCNFDVFYNEYTLVDSNNLEYLIQEERKNGD